MDTQRLRGNSFQRFNFTRCDVGEAVSNGSSLRASSRFWEAREVTQKPLSCCLTTRFARHY